MAQMTRKLGAALTVLAVSGWLGVGCVEPLDTTRVAPSRGTLGEEIYEVVCRRIAAQEAPADVSGSLSNELCDGLVGPERALGERTRALAENRARLVQALDRVMPEAIEDDLQTFMVRLLPLYDPPEERLPRQTRAGAELLERIMNDDQVLAALQRLSVREGYRPLRLAIGLARPLVNYEGFDSFATRTLDTIDTGGVAHEQWEALLRALALEMATAERSTDFGESTLGVARDLLFRQDPIFGAGSPAWVTRRDSRGIVMVATPGGVVSAPFVDFDGDGLADVDAYGQFVDGAGAVLDVPAPFRVADEVGFARDASERALRTDGSHYFQYVDADTTLLAGLLRESGTWFDPGQAIGLDLAYGLPALLGPRIAQTETFDAATLAYMGPDTSRGALFDLLYALGTLLDRPVLDDVLAVTEALVRDHENELAAVIEGALFVDRQADGRTAALERPSNLWDDQIQVVTWIAQQPGLMEAVLRAFADPRSKYFGRIYAEMMRYTDLVSYLPTDLNRRRSDVLYTQPVDRSRPDVRGNQSIFTRSIALIHDLDRVRLCNKEGAQLVAFGVTVPGTYSECELFEVDNAAELYALSIIGQARIEMKPAFLRALSDTFGSATDAILESESGIDGFTTRPTPYALSRMVFGPRNDFLQHLVDPPLARDGTEVESRHAGTIFAWEREYNFGGTRTTFFEAMSPLIEAFETYDARVDGEGLAPPTGEPLSRRRHLFGELIAALQLHWPSRASDSTQRTDPGGVGFSYQDGAVAYEENLIDAFGSDGGLIERLHELSRVLDGIEVRPGVDGIDVMAEAAEQMVDPNRNGGLAARDGRIDIPVNDGTRTARVTPLLLALDALSKMDAAFEAEPERHTAWLRARSRLVDQLMAATFTGGGAYRLNNRRTLPILRLVVSFLRDRIAAHRRMGDLSTWAATLHERAETSMGSAIGSGLIGFMDAVQNDPESKDELGNMLAYMVGEGSAHDAFVNVLVSVADLLQLLEDDANIVPLLRALSEGIAADASRVTSSGGELILEGSALDASLQLMREVNEVDDRRMLMELLQNLVRLDPGEDETPLEVILDVIAEVNRSRPGAGTSLDTEDYRLLMQQSYDFMMDESHGMERLYRVIQEREAD